RMQSISDYCRNSFRPPRRIGMRSWISRLHAFSNGVDSGMDQEADIAGAQAREPAYFFIAEPLVKFQKHDFPLVWRQCLDHAENLQQQLPFLGRLARVSRDDIRHRNHLRFIEFPSAALPFSHIKSKVAAHLE